LINLSGDHVFNKTNTLKLALFAFSCMILVVMYFVKQKQSETYRYKSITILLVLLVPIILTIPGLRLSEGKYSYNFDLELVSQMLCVLWCFLIYSLFDISLQVYKFWKFVSVAIVYVCLVGLLEKVGINPLLRFGLNPFESYWAGDYITYNGFQSRIQSTFGNINYFAGWLIQLTPVYIALAVLQTQKSIRKVSYSWKNFLPVLMPVLLLASLALTGTRSAIAGLFISLIVFMVVYFGKFSNISATKIVYMILAILGVLFGLVLLFNPEFSNRVYALLDFTAWESRLVPWRAAYDSIQNAPIFGYGLGSSYQLYFEYAQVDRGLLAAGSSYSHVHFEWLEILQEGGLVGLFGYFIFWVLVCGLGIKYIRNKANHKSDQVLMLGLLTGLLAYHLHGFFSVAPRMVVVRSMAYLLVAFVFILSLKFDTSKNYKLIKVNELALNVITLLVLFGSLAWLIPYAYGQYQLATGLAVESKKPSVLTDLAMSSEDVYVLDNASYKFAEQKNIKELEIVSERLGNIFPNYRNNLYFQAYAAYLKGDFETAKGIALNHQNKDLYNEKTNHLLAAISLRLNDGLLFKRQVELAVTRVACKIKLIDPCLRESIVSNEGKMALPIQFTHTKNIFHIFLDKSFFLSLVETMTQGKLNTQDAIVSYSKFLAKKIGNSKFFIPSALKKDHKNLQASLGNYIHAQELISARREDFEQSIRSSYDSGLPEQIRLYYNKQEVLKMDIQKANSIMYEAKGILSPHMNIDEFMMRRAFLKQLIQWFVSVLTLTDESSPDFVQLN
jgi:O-antigen ligase